MVPMTQSAHLCADTVETNYIVGLGLKLIIFTLAGMEIDDRCKRALGEMGITGPTIK